MNSGMKKAFLSVLLVFSFAISAATIPADAAGYCPNRPGGKCPAKKVLTKKATDYTPAQRKKIMEDALKVCKKKYGAGARIYRFDYANWKVICWETGW